MFSLDRVKLKDVKKMCGVSDSEVSIVRNSAEPYKIGAYAYTRGKSIYVAPGCDETIPHEISHYKQQKQSGYQNTTDIINGQAVNDDIRLEANAERHKTVIPKVMLNNIVDSDADMGQNKNIPAQRVKINLNVNNDPVVNTSYKYRPIDENKAIKSNPALRNDENNIFRDYEKTFQFKGFIDGNINRLYKGEPVKKCQPYDQKEIEGISGSKQDIDDNEEIRRKISWKDYLLKVALPKTKLKRDENIVFIGHGGHNTGEKFSSYMETYDKDLLAEFAAKIKKPWFWRGKIILFGCSTSNLAEMVSKKYTEITGKSVTVIGSNAPIELYVGNGESYSMNIANCQETVNGAYANDRSSLSMKKDNINVLQAYGFYKDLESALIKAKEGTEYFGKENDYLNYYKRFGFDRYCDKDREIKKQYLPYLLRSIEIIRATKKKMEVLKYDENLISLASSIISKETFVNDTINNYPRDTAGDYIREQGTIEDIQEKYSALHEGLIEIYTRRLDITDTRQFSAYQYNKWNGRVEKNKKVPWYKRIFGRKPTI